MHECRICASTSVQEELVLPETMFGTGVAFAYRRCAACGCVQIETAPADMAPYYPSDYYSFAAKQQSVLYRLQRFVLDTLIVDAPSGLFDGRDWFENGARKSIRDAKVKRNARILDVGCGQGELIAAMRSIGFTKVLGIDPFVAEQVLHANGARVLKIDISQAEGPFDLVMMHHSLEHIWDQKNLVRHIARLLAPEGQCIIRIPTIDCWAWEEYGESWVQLDPPRHFYLHSRQSIVRLLEDAGLTVTGVVDDSIAFQVLASEKIRFGVEKSNRKEAAAKARALNHQGRGDSIAVHARKQSALQPS